MAGSSTGVVLAAMFANGGIAVLKFIGFLLTGSPSMLAETYHSISDTGNQVLLLVGIKYSQQDASRRHPFGYGKAQFFYAFLVSVLLFGIAGWESLKHGISEVRAGGHETEAGPAEFLGYTIDITPPVDPFWIVVAILLGGIAFETYAFVKANSELRRQMETYGWSGYREAFDRTSDLTTLTAFTEDTVALAGLVVALFGIVATRITENPIYDAFSAVVIGVLLMGFAVLLAIENKRLILGESLASDVESDLRGIVESQESVTHVDDFRTMFIGSGQVLVTADVSFDSGLTTEEVNTGISEMEAAMRERDDRVKTIYIEPEL
ncbi:cation diffusion facilitator family transporter [Natronomonas gomsonensis]|uniref:cation diffusion facilitator family transporter n=1 Tax=Natronomonas gomsonensis TaxID=1046043 RepID=UPI0020CA611A|nr:cation diffusion facilitator family transporter [Natronomonas gomsonensis]MCY4731283.1 cation diffusion facilitator family transporter [Natronomonas gomsonensis]